MANRINAVDIPSVFTASSFLEIKQKLVDFLSNQDEFKDYSFSGSRINVLLDMLAYNTMYMQQFSNTAIYEAFYRTAKMRSSVVQHAQDDGYFPTGKSAATTAIRVTAYHTPLESSPISITIGQGTKFTGSIENTDFYNFATWDDVEVIKGTNNRYIATLRLVQGRIVRQSLTFAKNTRILINDPDIDRRYVRMYVDGALWTDWTTKPLVGTGSASTVFYQRETIDGYTEIYFGEGTKETVVESGQLTTNYVGGLKPSVGSNVVIEYISTDGSTANGCKNFEYIDTIPNLVIEKIDENPSSELGINDPNYVGATGGGDIEDIERIREMGSVMKETQRRAVTASDYEAFVSHGFGNIVQAVQCYTNQDKPGYAFIAIKPKDGLYLTTVQKEDIQTFLQQYNLATITPVVHSPQYLFVKKNVKVTYSINDLSNTEEWLQGKVLDAIDRYYTEEVELFNKGFFVSKMNTRVDECDVSIMGTTTTVELVREVENFYTSPEAGVTFLNSIYEKSMWSSDINFTSKITGVGTYPVHYVCTAKNGLIVEGSNDTPDNNAGLVLIGPFAAGDITGISEYKGTDFDKYVIDGRDKYYPVGYVNYLDHTVTFNLDVLQKSADQFSASYIEMYARPTESNIFTGSGSMIVFENKLRPQYTNITMEAIFG